MARRAADLIADPRNLPGETGSPYPAPHDRIVAGRTRHRLSPVLGLQAYGVNMVHLAPGAASSARHWHSAQDEFVYIVEGAATLVTDEGETPLAAGMSAGFPAGNANGHQIVNRSERDVWYLEVGDRPEAETVSYPDIDMLNTVSGRKPKFTRKDGSDY